MNILKEFSTNSINYLNGLKNTKTKTFDGWTLWERIWLISSTLLITLASYMTWDPTNQLASWVALISSVTGMWCVILVAKGKISNYIFGFVNIVFYAWAAYMWQLYGDFMLNAFYFLPMQFYGWYIWTKPDFKINNDNVVSKFLSNKARIFWALITAVATYGYGVFLTSLGGNTPYLDSASTVFSIIAMILMAKAYAEQWVLWIIVDAVTVVMWANIVFQLGGIFNMGILIMWCCWTINALVGFFMWVKRHKNNYYYAR